MRYIMGSIITVVVLGIAFVMGGYVMWQWVQQPVQPGSTQTQTFVIPQGQSVQRIGERLQEQGLIRHELAFRVIVKQLGLQNSIQAGSFEVSPGLSLVEIAGSFTSATEDIWITLLEGWRVEQIAEYLAQQELAQFDEQEFVLLAQQDEGRLFPDTYLVPKQMNARSLHALLTQTFEKKITQGLATEISQSPHTLDDILIMASIVEREARGYEQMRLVAGVLWKRLEIGMPLQTDATLQYIRGYDDQQKTWWPVPLASDKQRSSPYNTYQHPGLPPRPIANPGFNALKATMLPVETEYLFYIHDRQGAIHFATTLDEHNANIQRYLR